LGFGASITLFYFSYTFAQLGHRSCALFLAGGIFVFFRTMTSATLTISKIERQKALWLALGPEAQGAWLERQKKTRRLTQDLQATRAETSRMNDGARKEPRKAAWQIRIGRIRLFFRTLWAKAY